MCPQTNIAIGPIAGMPGQAYDSEASNRDVVSRVAAVNIPFGVYCELNASGLLVPMQDATTGSSFAPLSWGISLFAPFGAEEAYVPFTVPNVGTGATASGYLKGQAVPVMRRGRVWASWDGGGTVTRTGPINVNHSSDGTHPQGVFTFSAVSPTAGHEIDIAPSVTTYNPDLVVTTGSSFTDSFGNVFSTIPVEIHI